MTPGRCPNQPSPRWQRISLLVFREPGRHSSCERCLHPQLGDRGLVIPGLSSQPDQLGPLGLAQRRIRVLPGFRGLSCHLHPLAQGHLMDADVAGDLSDRTAAVNDESYRLLLVLRRKCAACRTHFSFSRRIGQLSRVSTEAGTVHTVPPEVHAKTAQKHDYPSQSHRRSYARRSAAERPADQDHHDGRGGRRRRDHQDRLLPARLRTGTRARRVRGYRPAPPLHRGRPIWAASMVILDASRRHQPWPTGWDTAPSAPWSAPGPPLAFVGSYELLMTLVRTQPGASEQEPVGSATRQASPGPEHGAPPSPEQEPTVEQTVQAWHDAGRSQRAIARELSIDRPKVRQIIDQTHAA